MGILNDIIRNGRELYEETKEIFQEGREIIEHGKKTLDDFVKETQRLEREVNAKQESKQPQKPPKVYKPTQREVIKKPKAPKRL